MTPQPSKWRINRAKTGPDGTQLMHGTARYDVEGGREELAGKLSAAMQANGRDPMPISEAMGG
jgi:hypothetical protein